MSRTWPHDDDNDAEDDDNEVEDNDKDDDNNKNNNNDKDGNNDKGISTLGLNRDMGFSLRHKGHRRQQR